MNKFLKKAAAVLLAAAILTGCKGNTAGESEGSELSEEISDVFDEQGNVSAVLDVSDIQAPDSGDSTVTSTVESDNAESGSRGSGSAEISESSSVQNTGSVPAASDSSVKQTVAHEPPESSAAGSSEKKSGGFAVDWDASNTWEESGKKCGTVNVTITNNSAKGISGWTVKFSVPDGFEISDGWNGAYSIDGSKASVTNVDYNADITTGGSVSFGFNYRSPESLKTPKNLEFNGSAADSGNVNNANNNNNNNNNANTGNNDKNVAEPAPTADVKELLERSPKAKQGDDWLHTDGSKIVDKNGKEVWLTGVNWFGYNTGTNTFDGLWASNLVATVKGIADHGFNLIRVPISAELLNQWAAGEYPKANYNNAYNEELNAMNSLQIFDYFLKLAEENGIKVMPDIHSAQTDPMGHNAPVWYTDKVSADDYFKALEWLADRYKDNDTIIAMDLKNEPHGKPGENPHAIWNGSEDPNNWKYIAETAANKILAKNPNVLIMIEGTEIYSKKKGDYSSQDSNDYYFNWWGGNLRGVKDYPVDLGKNQNKVVYSPHDYGPTVYEQPWFKGGYDYDSLIKDCWQDNWLYIAKDNTAPLLIGEWGGFMREPNLTWMTCMRKLIKDYRLNHTFWCLNANSGDTGGLLLDDFTTWDTEKYNFVKEVLWQENGKFVGLDHEIPLGADGAHV